MSIGMIAAGLLLTAAPAPASATAPTFDRSHWEEQEALATGKMRRGAGLTALGAASLVPTVFLIHGAAANPPKYLAWSVVMALTTIGMTGHGIASLGFGNKQRAQARRFVSEYERDPQAVDAGAQRDAHLHDRKKSLVKVAAFGGWLALEGGALLANGIVLDVQRSRGDSIGGATTWPSYVVGGLLFAGGAAILVRSSIGLHRLRRSTLSSRPAIRQAFILPDYQVDPRTGGRHFGVSGGFAF